MSWSELHPLVQEALRTTFAVGLLVLLVLLIRKPFARRFGAKSAYLLWALPLVRFVTPPLPGNWSLAGLLGFNQSPATTPEPVINEWIAAPHKQVLLQADTTREVMIAPAEPVALSAEFSVASSTSLLEAILAQTPLILTMVWITGMVLWLGRSVYRQRQFLELIEADSEPAQEATVAEATRLAKQLGLKRVPDVRASLLCSGPLVTGLKNPVILLPLWFEEDYEAAERRDALVHELMHVKRRDLWAFQAARIVAATQWFNPLAHIALRAFRTDQEAACDADVLARAKLSPAAYGRTLVKAARLARPSDRRIAAASLTLAHPIKERLIMMTHPTPSLRSRLLGGTLAIALGAGAVFATASAVSVAQELDGGEDTTKETRTIVIDGDHDMDMSFSFSVDGETFTFDMADLPPMPPMPDLPPMPGLIMSQDGNHFSMTFNSEDFEMDEQQLAEFESKMEAWGEEMEAWGEVVEARVEAWSDEMEPQIEAWAEANADKWEAYADRIAEQADLMAELYGEYDEGGEIEGGVASPETRDFGSKPFDKVEVGSGITVVYTQDPRASVSATLERGRWDQVEVKVEGKTLIARKKGNQSWGRRGPKLTVYASSKGLKSVDTASGAAFKGNVVADDLSVDASSGSSISIEGACKSLNLDASSGASVSLGKLECQNADVDASSGSSIQVFASSSVDVDASSGSSIRVSGNPKDVKKDTSSGASVSIN